MRFTLHPILWLVSLSFLISPLGDIRISANEAPPTTKVETSALTDPVNADPVNISIHNEETSVQPGRSFFVAVQIEIQDNWYAYWKNPGQVGVAPEITWDLPEGFEVGDIKWPTPQRLASEQGVKFGYEKNLTLLAEIKPAKSYSQKDATIKANVRWLVCSDTSCLPGETPVTIHLTVSGDEAQINTDHQELFKAARANVPKKHEAVTAKRHNGLIEIGFHDTFAGTREIADAEFFSEHKKAIDLNVPSLVQQPSNDSKDHTIIVKETTQQPSIKGVLVLHTPTGPEAYEIDTPISSSENSDSLIGEAPRNETEHQAMTNPSFEFEGGLTLAILLAFIGGMTLNLMPCVLPVISLKILGFIKLAGQSRKLIFQHGAAFSLGVLLSFWVLAGLLLILQAYGRSVGWGFQLQEPIFVGILAALLFMFGLSLFGVFELGTSIMSAAGGVEQKAGKKNQLLSSFFSGVLATAVATPCTGPFLGSAIGYAFTLPAYKTMMIFTSLGLGMSFPYIAISAFPALLRFLPKPGPWMITFKEMMGFLMMASVIWLVWVFSAQTNGLAVTILLAGFFFFAIACWIYGRWATPMRKKMTRMIGTAAALVFIGIGTYMLTTSTSSWVETMGGSTTSSVSSDVADNWEEFSAERVEELRKQGIPVFIDFTAKWCLICQTNHIVLTGDEVESKFKERGVVKMKADWTKKDEMIAAELRKFGRNSVPLYVFYDSEPEAAPKILPQVLTSDIVLGSME